MTLNLTNIATRTLAALSTGHESDAPNTAAQVAEALGETPSRVAHALGRLRSLGLVERDTGQPDGATWARYDSAAPGLDLAQAATLVLAENARPSRRQVEALETFGPDLGDGCHGLARKPDAPRKAESYFGACEAAREAAALGAFYRAAALLIEARPWIAGHGRRDNLERKAADYERQGAEAEAAQERPQVPAYGDTLPNGTRVLGVAHSLTGRAYVMAETLGRAGHPFATWSLEPGTWATHWGTYHETAQAAAATLAERAACN